MDCFSEQLLKREETSADRLKKTLIYAGGIIVVIGFLAMAFFNMGSSVSVIMLVLAIAFGYGLYYISSSFYVEYEYTFTNGELDIAKILGKKKRVELLSADVRKFTEFGKYSDDMPDSSDITTVISSDNIASHEYYAEFECEKYGKTRLIFAPNETMLENIMNFLPYTVKRNIR
ncbi:MAG: hypothetical protein K2G63_06310 [Oscillospiraceae bacterium]|nr:hypothetical protein [Oscillospiraceae bacterium]